MNPAEPPRKVTARAISTSLSTVRVPTGVASGTFGKRSEQLNDGPVFRELDLCGTVRYGCAVTVAQCELDGRGVAGAVDGHRGPALPRIRLDQGRDESGADGGDPLACDRSVPLGRTRPSGDRPAVHAHPQRAELSYYRKVVAGRHEVVEGEWYARHGAERVDLDRERSPGGVEKLDGADRALLFLALSPLRQGEGCGGAATEQPRKHARACAGTPVPFDHPCDQRQRDEPLISGSHDSPERLQFRRYQDGLESPSLGVDRQKSKLSGG